MSDNKLRCALIYRIEGGGKPVCIAKYDHAGQYETHGGADSSLYGGRDKSYAEAVAGVIQNDPPTGLAQSGQIGGFKVVQSDVHQVIYGADMDGLSCAVITGTQYQSRVAIQMLQELYKEFSGKYGKEAKTAAENALSKKAKIVLTDCCKKYEDPTKVDKTAQVLGAVDAVKGQMQGNIANMLKNTEKAESLAEKSDQLNEQASVFKKRSTDLKKQMQWKNLKMTLLLGGVVAVILICILVPVIKNAKAIAGKGR
jgi:vesicle-associated membrane protein 7